MTEELKSLVDKGEMLPLMEEFYTIQGEGYYKGTAAYFVRIGGCDVGCHWCDVKESWNAGDHEILSVEKIISDAKNTPAKLIILTGGEPLMYDLGYLCKQLHLAGFQINIETSGAYPFSGEIDWVCFSPKKFKEPKEEFFSLADELKVVVFHSSDIQWAEQIASKITNKDCKLYLQPEWGKSEHVTDKIIDFVKDNPDWNISLQTHKYLNIR